MLAFLPRSVKKYCRGGVALVGGSGFSGEGGKIVSFINGTLVLWLQDYTIHALYVCVLLDDGSLIY